MGSIVRETGLSVSSIMFQGLNLPWVPTLVPSLGLARAKNSLKTRRRLKTKANLTISDPLAVSPVQEMSLKPRGGGTKVDTLLL